MIKKIVFCVFFITTQVFGQIVVQDSSFITEEYAAKLQAIDDAEEALARAEANKQNAETMKQAAETKITAEEGFLQQALDDFASIKAKEQVEKDSIKAAEATKDEATKRKTNAAIEISNTRCSSPVLINLYQYSRDNYPDFFRYLAHDEDTLTATCKSLAAKSRLELENILQQPSHRGYLALAQIVLKYRIDQEGYTNCLQGIDACRGIIQKADTDIVVAETNKQNAIKALEEARVSIKKAEEVIATAKTTKEKEIANKEQLGAEIKKAEGDKKNAEEALADAEWALDGHH